MNNQTKESKKASKLAVLAVLSVIIIGVTIWTSVSINGLDQPDPEIAQDYAKLFKRRCMRDISDEKTCMDIIGFHHRKCFTDSTIKERPDQWGSAYLYDKDGYLQCMRNNLTTE